MASTTVRFSQVVEKAGQPEAYTLWVKPEQDKVFTSLLRQNRVMTVHQETVGSKADYGSVGYVEDRQRSLLVFPKSLKRFEGKRIIGIKYDELKEATSAAPEPAKKVTRTKTSPKKKAPRATKPTPTSKPPKPKPKPTPKTKKKPEPPPPPPNQIPFPKPEIVKRAQPAKAEDPAEELAAIKKAVRQALEALAKDKPVTAYNLLQSAVESD